IGCVRNLSNAWNYLSHLYHQLRVHNQAEFAAKKALEVYAAEPAPIAETLGTYQFKLALILASQGRFAEAIPIAEAGIRNFSVFHIPPDDFLSARQDDLARMRNQLNPNI